MHLYKSVRIIALFYDPASTSDGYPSPRDRHNVHDPKDRCKLPIQTFFSCISPQLVSIRVSSNADKETKTV